MEIYLIQHGEAKSKEEDPERSLTPSGEEQVRITGRALSRLGVTPDLIIASTKKRAQQTAEAVAQQLGYPSSDIRVTDKVDPLSPPEESIGFLKGFADRKSVIIAGHLPSVAEIASYILSEGPKISIHFEMGGVCRIDVSGPGARDGDLRWHLLPPQLRLIAG